MTAFSREPSRKRARTLASHAAPRAHGDMVRAVIADGHPLTRFGVRRALEERGFAVCAEAADGPAAVAAALRERPDVCVLELDLPGDAIAAIESIVSALPETPVVVLTGSRDDPRVFNVLRAGASGYLPKDVEPARLAATIEAVLAGDVSLPRSVVNRLVASWRETATESRSPFVTEHGVRLTKREADVLELLRAGLTTAEIAKQLFISQVTVRTHIASVVRKLAVPDRNAVVQLFGES